MIRATLVSLINRSWPMLILITITIILFKACRYHNTKERQPLHKEISEVLFILYIYLLLDLVTTTNGNSGVNLIPFTEIFRYSFGTEQFIYNVLWNIIVFIPIGYFISRFASVKRISPVIMVSLLLSLSVELVQLKIGRSFDIDDIMLNVTGGLVGFLIYIALDAIRRHLPGVFQKDFIYNILALIVVVLVILYFASLLGISFGGV